MLNRKLLTVAGLTVASIVAVAALASAQESNTPSITSTGLVDRFTNTPVTEHSPLLDGTFIDPAITPIDNYDIEVTANATTESVVFAVNGHEARLETQEPYTLDISTLRGPTRIDVIAYDTDDRTGAASKTTTIHLNLGPVDTADTIRINNAASRDGGVRLDAASIRATDPNGAPVWIYLDTDRYYNSVEWWINEPPDDRQNLIGQTSTNIAPYYLGEVTDTGPQPQDLADLDTGTHSITATGLLADGQTFTVTAWFTYIALGEDLGTPIAEAPATPDPNVSVPTPAPRVTLPPVTLPPVTLPPAPPTTEPELQEGELVTPPLITPPSLYRFEILSAELITLFDYPREAHLIIETDFATTRARVDLACIDTIYTTFGPPAFLYDSEYDLEAVPQNETSPPCEEIVSVIDQHIEFPRFVTTSRNNTPARYWLLDYATDTDTGKEATHKHVIDTQCARRLVKNAGVSFAESKWRQIQDHPVIRNIDCDQAAELANTTRIQQSIESDDIAELPEPTAPQPPTTTPSETN